MYHSIHTEFIETPLIEVLEEGILACSPLGIGIHTEPMKEYFLSSLFLRMTGAQEQKLKCICWELATHDYEFRYKFLRGGNNFSFGEMSSKEDKEKLYGHLSKAAHSNICCSQDIVESVVKKVNELLQSSVTLAAWLQQDIDNTTDYLSQNDKKNDKCRSEKSKPLLMEGCIADDYSEVVYRHRNRCAHNLMSYQNNPPELEILKSEKYPRNNYVYRFIILVIIDEIFIKLYQQYKETITQSILT